MDPEDLPEEHRKYLEMKNNPKQASNTSIFAMMSAEFTDLKVSLAKMETRQETIQTDVGRVEEKVNGVDDKVTQKVKILEDDFIKCRTDGIGRGSRTDERFTWNERMQKVILTLIVFTIGLIFTLHFGIGFP